MKLGDGERAFRFARANLSFSPGTAKSTVIRAIALAGGIGVGNVESVIASVPGVYSQGYVASGRWSDAFHKVVTGNGLEWSIQDNEVQLIQLNTFLSASIPDITPDSGLVGSPEMGTPEKKGKPALVKAKFLLRDVKPGGRFNLRSLRYNGLVGAKKVEYEGDTHAE